MRLGKRTLDYKWVILIICCLMEFICLGFCSSNEGLYLVAVTKALEVPRSVYSFHSSIRYMVQVVVALFFGSLVHRFGIKKLVCAGLCALVSTTLIRSVATEVYHVYISSVLLGLGMVLVGGTMASTIVKRWFHQDIGKYTGIVMSANGIGGALAAQIVSPLINNGEVFGYRRAYFLSALITLAVSIVIILFLKDRPADPTQAATTAKKKPRGAIWPGMEYDVVKRKPYFYITAAMVFLTGISLQSISSISVAHFTDIGIPATYIATTATVSSLTLTCSKFLLGYTYDKRGLRFTLLFCHIMTIIAFVLKAILDNSVLGMVMAMIASVCTCFATPLETVMIPLLTNDLFGTASYNKVLGIFMAMNSLGLCLGSPLGNLYYDIYGTYAPCFWFFLILMVAVAIGFRLIIPAVYKDKEAILKSNEV